MKLRRTNKLCHFEGHPVRVEKCVEVSARLFSFSTTGTVRYPTLCIIYVIVLLTAGLGKRSDGLLLREVIKQPALECRTKYVIVH